MKRKKTKASLSISEITRQALEDHRRLLSPEEFLLLTKELEQPLYSAMRINPLKSTPASLEKWAQAYHWEVRPVPYCPTGWWITQADSAPGQTIEHRLGFFYIQDAASMLPVELFDLKPEPQQLILDMAASPGGKTTHLISRSGDVGLVVANDSSADRVTALRLVLQTWGSTSTAVTNFPGEKFGGWFPETFDRILLDAPCSMQNLRSTEGHPMRSISDKERTSLAQRQTRLLASGFQALKTGGQMVYATCTLAPEEDEAVLDNLLTIYGPAVNIMTLDKKLPAPAPGLDTDGIRKFNPNVIRAARLYPHRFGTSGFFCALITKINSVETPLYSLPLRDLEKTALFRMRRRDGEYIQNQISDAYGFNLFNYLESKQLGLWQRFEQIYILPEAWIRHFGQIPFQAVGMLLGDLGAEGFEPSHEWLTRFAAEFNAGKTILDSAQAAAWLHGEDIQGQFRSPQMPSAVSAVYDESGRLLGRGKVFNGRLKNMLPKRVIH